MPELPDIVVYIESLDSLLSNQLLENVRISSPLLLRTVEPSPAACCGKCVVDIRRLGKRIAIGLENDCWLVIHLMIAGRLHWRETNVKIPGKRGIAAFDFPHGSLLLTESGSKKRASLHVVQGTALSLQPIDCKPLLIIDLLRISPLQFPHFIPLFEKESIGSSKTFMDRLAERSTLEPEAGE